MAAPPPGWADRVRGVIGRPALSAHAERSYRAERLAQIVLPVSGAVLEGGFTGVVAAKAFDLHPFGIAVISAAPMFANLASAGFAWLAHGRRKVPLLFAIQACIAAFVLAIALLPESPAGGLVLVACFVMARLLIAGFITVRSVVWTLNYPAAVRARVTSRLTLITVVVMSSVSWIGSVLLDRDSDHFRWIYAVAAASCLLGAVVYGRVRLAGEEGPGEPTSPVAASSPGGPGRARVFGVLREDPTFARYLAWQFLLGLSNMMVEAPLVLLLTRDLGASYQVSILLTVVLPLALSVLTLPITAAWIDRVHIARFRAVHSWLWVAALGLTWFGAAQASLLWVGAGRAMLGLARSGGMLAWQLGHNDFAHPDRAGLYMGLHATLTGLRGAIAPFVGVALFVGWGEGALGPLGWPGSSGIGSSVWLVAAGLSTVATLGFALLDREIRSRRKGRRAG